jgi:CDP-glycerol glycerophosphotransferase (TagB/SpsB family)
MYSLLKKILFIDEDNPKLPYLYRFLIFFIRPLIQKFGVTCFVSCPNKPWGCNLEAFVCYLLSKPEQKKIYILNFGTTPSDEISRQYPNYSVKIKVIDISMPLALLKCICETNIFFVSEYENYRLPAPIVNLWHGIALKKIGTFQRKKYKKLGRKFKQVICAAAQMDQCMMAHAFGMAIDRVIPSGLPRHDWMAGRIDFPLRFKEQVKKLKILIGDKKLVLYAPTFRDENRDLLPLTINQFHQWATLLAKHGYILGIRTHLIAQLTIKRNHPNILDLSGSIYHHIEAIYPLTSILVTDYSSVCIDFMLTGKPIIGLDPSELDYSRGFILDFDTLFPGKFYTNFSIFLQECEKLIVNPNLPLNHFDYTLQKKLFLGHYQHNACETLYEKLNKLYPKYF